MKYSAAGQANFQLFQQSGPNVQRSILKSGDIIILQPNFQEDHLQGFLYSDGFYPDCIKKKSLDKEEQDQATFTILPLPDQRLKKLDDDDESKLAFYDIKTILARVDYDQQIEFGQKIILIHQRSSKFVGVVKDEEDNDQYYLSLYWSLSPECVFKIIPCYKSQIQNNLAVMIDTDILIASVFLDSDKFIDDENHNQDDNTNVINFSNLNKCIYIALIQSDIDDELLNQKKKIQPTLKKTKKRVVNVDEIIQEEEENEDTPTSEKQKQDRKTQQLTQKFTNYNCFQGDFILQNETGTNFRILLQSSGKEQDENHISFGDAIRIQHLQTNSYLEVFSENEQIGESRFLNNDQLDLEHEYSQIIRKSDDLLYFQVKNDRQTEMMHMIEKNLNIFKTKLAYWKILSAEHLKGKMTKNDKIYLQNMHNMMYLAVKETITRRGMFNQQLTYHLLQQKEPGIECEFQLIQENDRFAHGNQNQVQGKPVIGKQNIFYIMHRKSGYYLSIENNRNSSETDDFKDDSSLFDPNLTFRKPILNQNANQGDCFRFRFLSNEEQYQISFNHIDSSLQLLKCGALYFKYISKKIQHRMRSENQTILESEQIVNIYFTEMFHQITLCLFNLINFTLDLPYGKEVVKETLESTRPNGAKQKLLKEKELIIILQVFLDNLIPSNEFMKQIRNSNDNFMQDIQNHQRDRKSSRLSVSSKKTTQFSNDLSETLKYYLDLVKTIYLLIEAYGKQNQETSLIVLIFYYYFQRHLGYGLGAGHCLIQLLSTNQNLLSIIHSAVFEAIMVRSKQSSIINQPSNTGTHISMIRSTKRQPTQKIQIQQQQNYKTLLDVIFDRFQEVQTDLGLFYWTNFLKILRTLCVFQGQGMHLNQVAIGMRLFDNSKARYSKPFLVPIFSNSHQQLVVSIRRSMLVGLRKLSQQLLNSEFIDLELLEVYRLGRSRRTETGKYRNLLEFINNQFDLFADLSQDRNYFNIVHIREMIQMNELARYIKNENLENDNLRAKMVMITLNVYIDTEPYIPTKLPKFLRKTITQISYERMNLSMAAYGEIDSGEVELMDIGQTKDLVSQVYEKAVIVEDDAYESSFIKSMFALTSQHIETIKSFVQNCLFQKIIEGNDKVKLTHFNAKIFLLFLKMYVFKLVSAKGPQNRQTLYTYIQKILEVQEKLSKHPIESVNCYKLITKYICEIQYHYILQEEEYSSQQVIDFLCQNLNKVKTKISFINRELKNHLPGLRFMNNQDQGMLNLMDMSVLIEKALGNSLGSNLFDIMINHLLITVNDYSCKKTIFETLVYYMQPRRNIIKNIKKYQLSLSPEEKEVQKYLKTVSQQLYIISENAEYLKNKQKSEVIIAMRNIISLLIDIEMLSHQKSKIDPFSKRPTKFEGVQPISFARQNIIRHFDIHQSIINLIDNLQDDVTRTNEAIQIKQQIYLSEKKELIISLAKICFQILRNFVSNQNITNKKIIFLKSVQLTPYLKLINLNQYDLFAELYFDEPELCINAHYSTIQELVVNCNYYSIKILENLIFAGGYVIHQNVNRIIKLIFNKKIFPKFLPPDFDVPFKDYKLVEMTGHFPYLYQTRAYSFLRKLYKLTQAPKSFANLLSQFVSPLQLVKFVTHEPDIFRPNWSLEGSGIKKSALVVLKTHLKIQILCILREVLFINEKNLVGMQVIQLLIEFFDNEEQRLVLMMEGKYLNFLASMRELEMQTLTLSLEQQASGIFVDRLLKLVESNEGNSHQIDTPDMVLKLVCKLYDEIQIAEMRRNEMQVYSSNGDDTNELQHYDYLHYHINFNIFLVRYIFGFSTTVLKKFQDIVIKAESSEDPQTLANLQTRSFSIKQPTMGSSSTPGKIMKTKSINFDDTLHRGSKEFEQQEDASIQRKIKYIQALISQAHNFTRSLEGFIQGNMQVEDFVLNKVVIEEAMNDFRLLFNREMLFDFKDDPLKMQQLEHLEYKKEKPHRYFNKYTSSEYIIDSRLQDLLRVQEENVNDGKLQKLTYFLLSTQTSSYIRNQILLEERVQLISKIRNHQKFEEIWKQIYDILRQGLLSFASNELDQSTKIIEEKGKVLFYAIEILSHLIDLEGIDLSKGLEYAKNEYEQYYNSVNETELLENENERSSKMFKFYQKKRKLQQDICEQGFFNVFLEFVGGLPQDMSEEIQEEYDEQDEFSDSLQFQKKKLSIKLFKSLLILATKLLKGEDKVNKKIQNKIFEELTKQKNNLFLRKLHFFICREIFEFPKKYMDLKVSLKEDLKRIQFSYHFHHDHILSQKPCQSKKTLAYQLSNRQTKFVLKNFHKELFNKIKNLPKQFRHYTQHARAQSEELFTDFLLSEDIIYYVLKFTQLLVEDHHFQLQNFLREQLPSSQNNYDILSKIMELLRVYCSECLKSDTILMNYQTQMKILMCFDAIKELVQGPCAKNQERVCSIHFLTLVKSILILDDSHQAFINLYKDTIENHQMNKKSIVSKIQQFVSSGGSSSNNYKKKKKRSKQVNFSDSYWWSQAQMRILTHYGKFFPSYARQLAQSFQVSNPSNFKIAMISQIKFKCVITLESLIDGDQITLLKLISEVIGEPIITQNLTKIYEKYRIVYKTGKSYSNEVFDHLEQSAPTFDIRYDVEKCINANLRLFDSMQSLSNSHKKYFKIGSVQEIKSPESALQDLWKSLIIETGFSFFTLLTSYYYMKQNDSLERIQEQIEKNRMHKQKLFQNKFIIFQICYFFLGLYQTSKQILTQINESSELEKAFQQFKLEKAPKGYQKAYQLKLGYRALRFFAKRTGTIEVIVNQQLKRVIFPLMPHCFSLNNPIKREFSNKIDRFSSQTKVESVLLLSKEVIEKLKYEYQFKHFYRRRVFINLLASNVSLWKQLSFVVIIMMNILVLVNSRKATFSLTLKTEDSPIFALNMLLVCLSFLIFSFFLMKKAPYLLKKARDRIMVRRFERLRTQDIKYRYLESSGLSMNREEDLMQMNEALQLHYQEKKFRMYYERTQEQLIKIWYLMLDGEMLYFLLFTSFSLASFYNRFFSAFLLLDVFWRFPTLSQVLKSIWRPKKQIVLILFLFVIVQYFYTLIWFYFYGDIYSPDCQNLKQCFSVVFDITFKTDGGFPGFFASSKADAYQNEDYTINILSILEFLYIFLVILLLSSIITGIIIDTFSVLREESEVRQKDIDGYCLICGIDRGTIDKKAKNKKGFKFHVKYEHSSWNYIFYISYLEDKNNSEYLGLESYVQGKILKQEINWFPLNRALSIPSESDSQQELQYLKFLFENKLQQMEEKVDILLQKSIVNNEAQ